jgi:hypothetical protein
VFQPICGSRTVSGKRVMRPGTIPSPSTPGDSSLPSKSICIPTQIPRNGRPSVAAERVTTSRPLARSARMHAPKLPTPGSTTASAASISPASVVSRASAPRCWSAFSADRRFPIP